MSSKRSLATVRVLVWSGVVLVALLTFIEWRARSGYMQAQALIDAGSVEAGSGSEMTLASLKNGLRFSPTFSEPETTVDGFAAVSLEWFGLLGTYKLQLLLDKEGGDAKVTSLRLPVELLQ